MNKHKKSQYFFRKGLFTNLSSFSELESRISSLPEIERGDAFEVFAEVYFNTQNVQQAQEVWPEKLLPQSLRDKFGIAVDAGIDGIFKTNMGLYKAYQVKFRSNRNALTWDNDGLGKFFGQTDRVDERVLFTNSIDLSHITNTRIDFYSIKGNDLDCLTQQDFQVIENWFETGTVIKKKKILGAHQLEAIDNILSEFSINDRVTAIMACGTGKTLVALSIAEKIEAQTILVLLPSLALIKQTLHDWAKDHNWNSFNFLCVCSDNTVIANNDEIVLHQYDLDFPVTTEKETVERFLLNQSIQRKIIFSTYQSSKIVAQAMSSSFYFDLAIFDEAHKTASRQGANYTFALHDKNLSIKKRLFLTATPRHYNIDKKDKEGDQQVVFSMDDQSTYGQIAYQLSFRAAVQQDLICDYKVIISVVTSEMINRELLKQGEVLVQGDIIKAQRIANILAVQSAVEKYELKKIFSFHSSVSAAKSFTVKTNEGIGAYLLDFTTTHVNGDMSTSKRDEALVEFKNSQKAIVSNARCLTEGVNIPAVDMVAFISPKKSRVDIVQAAGRAMRKYDGKKCGYILIPLFLQTSENESIEEAIQKTQFDSVWDVLQAMQEQDESLVEIIAQLRQHRGKGLGLNDNRLRDRVETLGPELSLSALRQSITIQIVDKLGSNWDDRFGELIRFKEAFGHCIVPQNYINNQQLATWVGVQRHLYNSKNSRLTVKRIQKLTTIDFCWNPLQLQWENMLLELQQYNNEHGHCNIPQRDKENEQLATWVSEQRKAYNKNQLNYVQITKLKITGLDFDPLTSRWDKLYSNLYDFKQEQGHCNVPIDYKNNPQLGTWVAQQRKAYKQNNISLNRIARLKELEFSWNPLEAYQTMMLQELEVFNKQNGHSNVSQRYEHSKLGKWLIAQRIKYKKGILSSDLINKLNSLKIDWNPLDTIWVTRYQFLYIFQKQHGHCIVPQNYTVDPLLGNWVSTQRSLYSKKCLAQERIDKLNEINFVWNTFDVKWEESFICLVYFYNSTGHCDVPSDYEDYSLFRWVSTQRTLYQKNKLELDRVSKLNKLNFRWNFLLNESWEQKFIQLCQFQNEYGHCNVPLRYHGNSSLGTWVNMQRSLYKKGTLIEERVFKLLNLGFIFDPISQIWKEKISALCEFKLQFGHCIVPAKYKENPSLGTWVSKQRMEYRVKRLSQDKVLQLEALGFIWEPKNKNKVINFNV